VILAALVIVAIVAAIGVFLPQQYFEKIQWKWFRFSTGTILLVWLSLHAYWKIRKSLRFWCIFLSFLAVHLLGVGHFYYVGGGLSTVEVAVVGGIEWGCMAVVIYKVLRATPDLRQRHPRSPWTPTL
jgi:hypothetical protein